MNKNAQLFSYLLGVNKTPKTYTSGGWVDAVKALAQSLAGLEESEFPKSRDELVKLDKEYKESFFESSFKQVVVCGINADKFLGLSEEKQTKEFEEWLKFCENNFFPAHVLALNVNLKKHLEENYRFQYSEDGKRIVYSRVQDITYANIWEESADSEKPFSKLQGVARDALKALLVTYCEAKEVNVYYKGDDKNKPQVVDNVPVYRLFRTYRDEIIKTITGSENAVAEVIGKFDAHVSGMERKHSGKLTTWEVQKGLVNLTDALASLDEGLDDFSFLYDKDFAPKDLTNDPAECAYAYFDLNSIKAGPTPDFDGFMDAIVPECRDLFMAAVYATVFAESLLNQYIWIHGEGGDGKSSFLQAVMKFLGGRLCCSLGQTLSSEFGLENAVGKRMIMLSDVKTGLSVKSQLIHNLTGHDAVSINRKNKPIVTKTLEPIVWIAANEAPDVNFDNRNEARRCLYIKMQEPSEDVQRKFYFTNTDGSFVLDSEGRKVNNGYDLTGGLLKEMPHILYKCKQAFEKVCPAPYHVIKPGIAASQLAETNCMDIDANTWKTYLVETFDFTDNEEDRLLVTDIMEAVQDTKEMHSDRSTMNQFVKRDIKRLLTTAFGCRNKTVHGIRYLAGLKRKTQ